MNDELQKTENRRTSIERAVSVRGETSGDPSGPRPAPGPIREVTSLTADPVTRQRIGEIMVDQGTLTPEQVDEVLAFQQDSGLSFGDAATRLGLADEAAVKHALAMQFGYPSVPPGNKSLGRELIVAHDPESEYSEAMRGLRANLLASWAQGGSRSVAVIAADVRQSCTELVGNLGVTFAQLGKRALLIDTNFKHSELLGLFGLPTGPGLSTMLSARSSDSDIVHRVPFFPTLSVLGTGPTPPNVQELLTGDRFKALLRSAREQYDVVLIVTPPGGADSDAESVARSAGNVLLVAKRNQTRRNDITDLVRRMERFGVSVDGCVLID